MTSYYAIRLKLLTYTFRVWDKNVEGFITKASLEAKCNNTDLPIISEVNQANNGAT